MIIFKKIFFLILFICLFSFSVLYSKEIRFEGLRSLSSDDLKIISLTISAYATFKNVEFLRVHDVDVNQDAIDVAWKTINSL